MFPEVREDLKDFEKLAAISVDVLVRVEGFKDKNIGRYIHGTECWQVNGWSGNPKVIEWWPLPENNTGTFVE